MADKTSIPFLQPDDPILTQIAARITPEEVTSESVKADIEKMLGIALGEQGDRTKPVLVGLAAPQIGISRRIILVDVSADGHGVTGNLRVFINPEIVWRSEEEVEWYEGCYSTDQVCGIVFSPQSLRVRAFDEHGNEILETYHGYTARIFRHEIDHLDGKEFVTHIPDTPEGNDRLHWVEDEEFPSYRDNEGWRTWPNKCLRERWNTIKGMV